MYLSVFLDMQHLSSLSSEDLDHLCSAALVKITWSFYLELPNQYASAVSNCLTWSIIISTEHIMCQVCVHVCPGATHVHTRKSHKKQYFHHYRYIYQSATLKTLSVMLSSIQSCWAVYNHYRWATLRKFNTYITGCLYISHISDSIPCIQLTIVLDLTKKTLAKLLWLIKLQQINGRTTKVPKPWEIGGTGWTFIHSARLKYIQLSWTWIVNTCTRAQLTQGQLTKLIVGTWSYYIMLYE